MNDGPDETHLIDLPEETEISRLRKVDKWFWPLYNAARGIINSSGTMTLDEAADILEENLPAPHVTERLKKST